MDAFTSFFDSQSSSRNHWNYNALRNFPPVSLVVQNHIKRVYLSLFCAVVSVAVGAYLHVIWNIGGCLTTLLIERKRGFLVDGFLIISRGFHWTFDQFGY